jgi:hypothetical protein
VSDRLAHEVSHGAFIFRPRDGLGATVEREDVARMRQA